MSSLTSSPKQNTTVYLLVCSFSLASITDIVPIFRRQRRFFLLFLLAAVKSALSILTVTCHVFLTGLAELSTQVSCEWRNGACTSRVKTGRGYMDQTGICQFSV